MRCYWRRDGVPIWRDADLIARETGAQSRPMRTMQSASPKALPRGSGIIADYVQPAYEDPAYRMLKQGQIPDNIDPDDPKIDDPASARAFSRLFDARPRRAGRLRAADAALDARRRNRDG